MDTQNNLKSLLLWVGIGTALILSLIAILLAVSVSSSGQPKTAGGIGALTGTEGTFVAANGYGYGTESSFVQVLGKTSAGYFYQSLGTASAQTQEIVTPISCNLASSTVFSLVDPFTGNATATVQIISFNGVGNATTTLLTAGTSTSPSSSAAPAPSLFNAVSIATTTPFTISSGITTFAMGNGILSSGASTVYDTIVTPAAPYVNGYATTTATGAGANSYVGGYTGCSGYADWWKM